MKFGIVSDIHANLEAFEAVLAELCDRGATRFICCGDIVGYGPDPNRCTDMIREMRIAVVAGNHDCGAVGRVPLDAFNSAASRAALWTQPLLTGPNRTFLGNLPLTAEEPPLFIVHSSPSAPAAWEYVLNAREAASEMEHYSLNICLAGHSHQPLAVERLPGATARTIRQNTFCILPGAKYFINAGSVGQPRDGDPRACCLLYDDCTRTMTYVRVRYDVSAVQDKIRSAGLPEYLASRLAAGR